MDAAPPIVLTTDFGLSDPFVGMMKGVILRINPRAAIIDLTHHVQPQNIRQAAFVLGCSHSFFPRGAIHVVVVDPGVGTERAAVLLETPDARYLAPDNGVLSHVLRHYMVRVPSAPQPVPIPSQCSAFRLARPEYWLQPVSNTFHGRDVFAPVAAHLSLGLPGEAVGEPVEELLYLPASQPRRESNILRGEVIYVDHFGNLVTNVSVEALTPGVATLVEIKGRCIPGISQTFHDGSHPLDDGVLALIGSHGFLEIAVRDGDAAATLAAGEGERVSVTLSP